MALIAPAYLQIITKEMFVYFFFYDGTEKIIKAIAFAWLS